MLEGLKLVRRRVADGLAIDIEGQDPRIVWGKDESVLIIGGSGSAGFLVSMLQKNDEGWFVQGSPRADLAAMTIYRVGSRSKGLIEAFVLAGISPAFREALTATDPFSKEGKASGFSFRPRFSELMGFAKAA